MYLLICVWKATQIQHTWTQDFQGSDYLTRHDQRDRVVSYSNSLISSCIMFIICTIFIAMYRFHIKEELHIHTGLLLDQDIRYFLHQNGNSYILCKIYQPYCFGNRKAKWTNLIWFHVDFHFSPQYLTRIVISNLVKLLVCRNCWWIPCVPHYLSYGSFISLLDL